MSEEEVKIVDQEEDEPVSELEEEEVSSEEGEEFGFEPEGEGAEQDEDEEVEEVNHSALLEGLIFASGEPLGIARLKSATDLSEAELKDLLESIAMKFDLEDSGIRLVQVAGKYQFRTRPEFAPYIRELKTARPRKLTPAALETLAIVAYRQPIVKSDVEKIRGVDATPTLKTLLERRLIRIVGHQASVGQPALYGTTDEFLRIFSLRSLAELPTLRDLKELDADPGETEEIEADAEEARADEGSVAEEEAEEADAAEEESQPEPMAANS
jgi:segregation and condensation protein B